MLTFLRKFFAAPQLDDDYQAYQARLLRAIMLPALLVWAVASLAVFSSGPEYNAWRPVSAATGFWILAVMVLGQLRYILLASAIFTCGLAIHLVSFSILSSSEPEWLLSHFVVVMLAGSLVLGWQAAAGLAGFGATAALILFFGAQELELTALPLPSWANPWVSTGLNFSMAAYILVAAARSLEQAFNKSASEVERRKQVEKALEASEDRFRKMADSVQEGFSVLEGGRIVYLNQRASEIFGYSSEECLYKSEFEFAAPEDKRRLQRVLKKIKRSGIHPEEIEFQIMRKDGSRRLIHNRYLLNSNNGEVSAAYVVTNDITEQRDYQEAPSRQLAELAALHAVATAGAEATSEEALIERTTQVIGESLYTDNFGVLLLDNEAGVLRVQSSYRGLVRRKDLLTIPVGEGITGRVAASGQSLRIPDVNRESSYLDADSRTQSELCVPLKVGERVIGVINAESAHLNAFSEADERLLTTLAGQLATAIEKVRLFVETQRQARELASLYESALVTSSQLEMEALQQRLYEQVQQLLAPDSFLVAMCEPGGEMIRIAVATELGQRLQEWENQRLPIEESGLTGYVIKTRQPFLVEDMELDKLPVKPRHGPQPARSWLGVPLIARDRLVGAMSVQSFHPHAFDEGHRRFMESLASQVAISLENARLFEETRRRTHELEALTEVSSALRNTPTQAAMLPVVLDQLFGLLKAEGAALALRDPATGEVEIRLGRGKWSSWAGRRFPISEGITGMVVSTGKPFFCNDALTEPGAAEFEDFAELKAAACAPMIAQELTIGALWVGRKVEIGEAETRLITAFSDIAASAIQRAALYEETQRRVHHLAALRTIDQTITASLDLRLTLNILLEQVTGQLDVDAATVLLLNPHTQTLDFAIRHGFHTGILRHTHLRLGEGYAGRAALERRIIQVPNLVDSESDFAKAVLLSREGFYAYYAVPLIAKGQVKGVLEIFHRSPLNPTPEWLEFLDALATQAAIAIDNAELFRDLQLSNQDLTLAYDKTLEGWSRALELRDRETEGHTQRVTELTMHLARAIGMSDAELVHVRRGALLHDIGKMGIPDSILLKPGPLTDEEWELMRKHPVYAHQLLSPIPFLRPALDIPYCHHEKWDGSGYPQGLKGEQIPLAARVFAVVDVWDAVGIESARPYQKPWPYEKIRAHIQEQSGKHFDARVAETFLELVKTI